MRIMFVCDATIESGLGHFSRCIAIADVAARRGCDIEFCGQFSAEIAVTALAERSFEVHTAPVSTQHLGVDALARRVDHVHADTYSHTFDSARADLGLCGVTFSSMEDGTHGRREADLVVDPTPRREREYRPKDGTLRLFRGAKAIPLRNELLLLKKENPTDSSHSRIDGKPLKVLVVMGGTDPYGVTEQIVDIWQFLDIPSTCLVVGGSLDDFNSRVGILPVARSWNIAKHYVEADLVISSAGTTVWEIAYLGTPMAILQVADNQREYYEFAINSGVAFGLGNISNGRINRSTAIEGLNALVADLGRTSRRLNDQVQVDGRGAQRITDQIFELRKSTSAIHVRVATIDDASILYDWRNDPSVRSVSRSHHELNWTSHLSWLSRVLGNSQQCLLIVEYRNTPGGTVRFDRQTGTDSWEVSMTLAPQLRGQRLSRPFLDAAEQFFLPRHQPVELVAEMLVTNQASSSLFQSAGYTEGTLSLSVQGAEDWRRLVKNVAIPVVDSPSNTGPTFH